MNRLEQAFAAALGVPDDTSFESLEFQNSPTWNSVAHMELVMELEQVFDFTLSDADVLEITSFVQTREVLRRRDIDVGDSGPAPTSAE